MPKKYQLLIDSPEYPKDSEATQDHNNSSVYNVTMPKSPYGSSGTLMNFQVEDRPTVWKEIVEEPEKKIVERWRGNPGESYYTIQDEEIEIEEPRHWYDEKMYKAGYYFANKPVSARAKKRTEIMCRLMGLAETIEEGSTEMKGAWTIGFDTAKDMDLMPIYTNNTVLNTSKLATFNTKENTQLFLDSAGQDAMDWYGEVK